MKIGVLGGTFDPIHIGHLIVAEEARVKLALEEVLFVPAGQPWQKSNRAITPAEHRIAMIRLAIASNPAFKLSLVDVERPGPSYSVDTIMALRELYPPETQFYYLVGMDAAAGLATWKEPLRLLELCHLVAVRRPGYGPASMRRLEAALPGAPPRVIFLDSPEIGVSSTAIRERVAQGLPLRYQVPAPVEAYIREQGLYRE